MQVPYFSVRESNGQESIKGEVTASNRASETTFEAFKSIHETFTAFVDQFTEDEVVLRNRLDSTDRGLRVMHADQISLLTD